MAEPGGIDALKAAARTSGCDVEEAFAQMAHVMRTWANPTYGANQDTGICSGLAGVWLDLLQKGEANTFRARVTGADPAKDLRNQAAQWWRNQTERPWLDSGDLEDSGKSHTYELTIRQPRAKTAADRYVIANDTITEMVNWLNATTGKRRFFLIHVPGHSMAAAKNRKGRIRFYDPNGGVVGSWLSGRIASFLRLYLTTPKIFDAYAKDVLRRNTIPLSVEKYRPREW